MFEYPSIILIIGHRETGKSTFAANIPNAELYDNMGLNDFCRTPEFGQKCLKNKEDGMNTIMIAQTVLDCREEVREILDYIVIMDDFKHTREYVRHHYDKLNIPVNFLRKGIFNCLTREFTPLE
jgi:hypothetical protein